MILINLGSQEMRRKLIIFVFLFSSTLCFFILLAALATAISGLPLSYIKDAALSSVLTLPITLFACNVIVNKYLKSNWEVSQISTAISGGLGLIFSLALFILLGDKSLNMGNIFIGVWIVLLGSIIVSIPGIFCSGTGLTAIFVSSITSGFIANLVSDSSDAAGVAVGISFLSNIVIMGAWISFVGLRNKNSQNIAFKKSTKDNEALMLDLLELAKERQSLLSKAEIIQGLKINIQTADNLLKEAELGELATLEIDEVSGILKYKFHI